jgi:LCP family protein required for cell wall assembly
MDNRFHKPAKQRTHTNHVTAKIVLLVIFVSFAVTAAYAVRTLFVTKASIDRTYSGKSATPVSSFSEQRPISILLLGVDTGAEGRIDKGNSDTMIVATINPKIKRTLLVSVPRDTAAQLIGTKEFDMQKINAAYNIGGSKMAKETVSSLLNVPINYYVTVNMGGLEQIVNAVGGVDVDVPFSFTSHYTGGQSFTKGRMHLNGSMALAYARMRHEDEAKGDYGRQERQQQVIKAVLGKAMSLKGISHFTELLKSITGNLKTDLNFDDMVAIFSHYRGAEKSIDSDTLHGQNAYVQTSVYPYPLAYQIASTSELQRVSDRIRSSLALDKVSLNNAETKQNEKNSGFVFGSVNSNQTYYFFNIQ